MLFHSLAYAILLLSTIAICLVIPPGRRWIILLLASFGFYFAWRAEYLLLLLLTATTCHVGALLIERSTAAARRRHVLMAVVVFNLAILFLFKYYGLFAQTANVLLGTQLSESLGFLLPVGISFYTFQAIGYVADVYQRKAAAETSLARTTLFIAFFPQLVAGPIERASRLLPALRRPIYFRWRNIRSGSWLILWGLFKKVVIADRLALLVDAAYDQPQQVDGGLLVLATYAFAFQIYCDFSGYTDMAIGSAKLFGVDLMQNFRVPYLASSLREFWARWHISLSTWFRDYVYIPLGGNQASRRRWTLNIMIVFMVSGLWHGAAWTYVIWGAIHGSILLLEFSICRWLNDRDLPSAAPQALGSYARVSVGLRIALTFHIVLVAWVFFRAESLGDALYILANVPDAFTSASWRWPPEFSRFELAVALLNLAWMALVEWPTSGNVRRVLGLRPRGISRLVVIGTLLLVLNFGIFSHPTQFVYFQF